MAISRAIKQAIREMDNQKNNPIPMLLVPAANKPTRERWGKVIDALWEAGYVPVGSPMWERRDKWACMCRRIKKEPK